MTTIEQTNNPKVAIIRYDTGWTPESGWRSETPAELRAIARNQFLTSVFIVLAYGGMFAFVVHQIFFT